MNLYIKQIEEKIKNKIELEEIKIIDNSDKHKKHASFKKDQFHLILEIKSNFLNKMKRLEAERLLISLIKKEFENKIHALEIKLK